jgi:hypothetical protein
VPRAKQEKAFHSRRESSRAKRASLSFPFPSLQCISFVVPPLSSVLPPAFPPGLCLRFIIVAIGMPPFYFQQDSEHKHAITSKYVVQRHHKRIVSVLGCVVRVGFVAIRRALCLPTRHSLCPPHFYQSSTTSPTLPLCPLTAGCRCPRTAAMFSACLLCYTEMISSAVHCTSYSHKSLVAVLTRIRHTTQLG